MYPSNIGMVIGGSASASNAMPETHVVVLRFVPKNGSNNMDTYFRGSLIPERPIDILRI
jgi:hypothetical protein